MEKQIISWITDYQNTGDEAVLRQVREVCWPIVEAVLQEKVMDDEQANNLREKGIERFPFIISKYQAGSESVSIKLSVRIPSIKYLPIEYQMI